jgi:hypothetical protein
MGFCIPIGVGQVKQRFLSINLEREFIAKETKNREDGKRFTLITFRSFSLPVVDLIDS